MIKNLQKIKIIAEIGVNHNGSIPLAKKLIKIAKHSGADFVKFQNWKAERLVTSNAEMANYQKINTKKKFKQIQLLKPLELKDKDYFNLIKYCKKNSIQFLSSPFDEVSYKFLTNKLKCKIIKIPSGEINNFLLLREINLNKHKIFLSTGMSTISEIANCINFIAKSNIYCIYKNKVKIKSKSKLNFLKKKIIIMHCVTDYPVQDNYANLKAIKTIKDAFKLPVGYSDHTDGVIAPVIAASFGAELIEKHLTINQTLKGPDHKASLNPTQFKLMVNNLRTFEKMLGNGIKSPQICEKKNMIVARKSIVAKKIIKRGETFTFKNITVKRPSGGKDPSQFFQFLGKTAKKNYSKDEKI